MKSVIRKIAAATIAAIMVPLVCLSSACHVGGAGDNSGNDGGINGGTGGGTGGDTNGNGGTDGETDGNGDNNDTDGNDGTEGGGGVEKQVYLDEIACTYTYTNYGSVQINKDGNGNTLSIYEDGEEVGYEHGFFAHAYSVISYDDIGTRGFTQFSAYLGINKTARVANSKTSLVFRILVDNQEVYASEEFNAYSDAEFVSIDIAGADRLTLVADSLGGNGNDHAVWADCKFTYTDDIKPDLKAFDVEFPSPYQVTKENILANATATAFGGEDLSGNITYTTDYKKGETGEFSITYKVSDGKAVATRTVKMSVLSKERFVSGASDEYLTRPFADFVYYGRSLLSSQSRLAYDLIMEELLKVNISDSSRTALTVNLLDNGIFIFPSEVQKIKKFLIYDEARLYFIYYWVGGENAGVTYTTDGAFVDTVTIKLYNGSGEYYNGQDNVQAYRTAESQVTSYFSSLTDDMTEAQMLYSVQNAYRPSITYSNVNYADGFYGAFVTKLCICSGYSKGYEYLAQRLGVRSAYVVGPAHAWNYIHADGDWYMTDTTWGDGNSYGLLGQKKMDDMGRYDYANYGKMPALSYESYDLDLMKYPLMSIKSGYMVSAGSALDLKELVSVAGAVADKTSVVSVTYSGALNTDRAGTYNIRVTAQNSLGNVVSGDCSVYVYSDTQRLTSHTAVQTGNSNFAYRGVSLYYGGKECAFEDGIYTKANGTLSLDFDISGGGYTYFTANVGIDKVIRDNVPWGEYANATVRVYADGALLYELKGIGWKKDYAFIALAIPANTNALRLEVTDTSGQGGVGWGDCTLYK